MKKLYRPSACEVNPSEAGYTRPRKVGGGGERRIRLTMVGVLVGSSAIFASSVAMAADTTGVIGNGTLNIGEVGAWRDASWSNSLADWYYTVGGGSDSNWTNNQYFNTSTSPNDKTSSATGASYQDSDLANNPGMQDAISSHAFLALPAC
jgi:hypothetical protein